MIQVIDKSKCCGCEACVQICPKQCILFDEDNEGFRYPLVDKDMCIDCGLCEKVCPEIIRKEKREPIKVYAAKHLNEEIRLASSSGGIFTLLAEQILAEKGVVFGARFDEQWEVVHDYTETKGGLAAFRGSKYVQSRIGDTYRQAESFLKQGRKVMFSGTPCQIAGLKLFLRKDYDNLLTVDFVCHGVPSPLVWRIYLEEMRAKIARQGEVGKNSVRSSLKFSPVVTGVNFREKSTSWKKYSFTLQVAEVETEGEKNTVSYSDRFFDNPYMQAFLANLSLRPSCYACPAKAGRSMSDITIGDFWGIQHIAPEIDDDLGVGLVMLHSKRMNGVLSSCFVQEMTYEDACRENICIKSSVCEPVYRAFFFRRLLNTKSTLQAVADCRSAKIISRFRRVLSRKLGL